MEPSLSPVPRIMAFALPCLSKRATLKAPHLCITSSTLSIVSIQFALRQHLGGSTDTQCEASPLPCFLIDILKLRSSDTSKKQALSYANMYYHTPILIFDCGIRKFSDFHRPFQIWTKVLSKYDKGSKRVNLYLQNHL